MVAQEQDVELPSKGIKKVQKKYTITPSPSKVCGGNPIPVVIAVR